MTQSNFKAPFLSLQKKTKKQSAEPTSQVNHQLQPLSFSNNAKEPCITVTDHLRHPQLGGAPFSGSQKRNQGYFFHCAFMSKGATECVI